jgi:hypothetical protein
MRHWPVDAVGQFAQRFRLNAHYIGTSGFHSRIILAEKNSPQMHYKRLGLTADKHEMRESETREAGLPTSGVRQVHAVLWQLSYFKHLSVGTER